MSELHLSEITIETLPPMRVACYRAASPTPEADSAGYLSEWVAQQDLAGPLRHFGFDVEVTPEQQAADFRGYEVWMTVPPEVQPAADVTVRDFEGGLYAVTTIDQPFVAPFELIPAAWKYLHEWVIASDRYQSGNHQWLEELISRPGGDDLKLYHPLMPAPAQPQVD